jgi:hypothetical protein
MNVVSINVKGNNELNTIFSKMWNENISNVFTKDLRCHPSSRALSYPMSSGSLFVISYATLLHEHISISEHNTPKVGKVSTTVMYAFSRPLSTSYTF